MPEFQILASLVQAPLQLFFQNGFLLFYYLFVCLVFSLKSRVALDLKKSMVAMEINTIFCKVPLLGLSRTWL